MRRQIPTRIIETGRLVRGSSGQGVGWLQTLADRFRNLRAQVAGIEDRLNSNLANGFPSCISAERTFVADTTTTLTIADYQGTGPLTVNPIFLSGQTYRIPVIFTPPGILHANYLNVGIETGFTTFNNVNRFGITPLDDYRRDMGGLFVSELPGDTIRYTQQQQVLGDFAPVMPFIPYFWNIVDEKSGRQYGQDLLPNGALLNTRSNESVDAGVLPDSELFEFDYPWQFERDGQVSFLFRPIMDLYQIASSDAQLPYGNTDDRSGGRRVLQATVRVEFHGSRYYTTQDVLKYGAFVTE